VIDSLPANAPLRAAVEARLAAWESDRVADRLWSRDGTLWAASGAAPDALAAWLGWLDLPTSMPARAAGLQRIARDVHNDGYARAAVLGMGGSSLAPELFSRVFGDVLGKPAPGSGGLELRILDSTHPDAVRGFREWAESSRTLFCVSSKSGTTTEPNAFHAALSEHAPALDFVAITDPGSPLADVARTQGFRAIVDGEPSVGGRYSALSAFGLLPAALHGVDLGRLLDRAQEMAEACRRPALTNPGLRLGALLGEAAVLGRDKLTLLTSPRVASFGDWVEQLVAESTGKGGRGIVPIVGEPIGDAEAYGPDRIFVLLTMTGETHPELDELAGGLAAAGHPVERLALNDPYDVGGEFVRWEVATAAAGIVLGINPFDQPNVQESKDATRGLLDAYRRTGALPAPAPWVSEPGIAAYLDPGVIGDRPVSVEGAVGTLLGSAADGDYVALQAFVAADAPLAARMEGWRAKIRDRRGLATTLGFGPRFLHSTGQLHKGGPPTGNFLQVTAEPVRDLPIPGWPESFGTLIAAQAMGDLASLQAAHRRVLRLHLDDLDEGLARIESMIDRVL